MLIQRKESTKPEMTELFLFRRGDSIVMFVCPRRLCVRMI